MRILAFAAIALGIIGTIFFLNFLSGPDETSEKKPAEKTTEASEPVSAGSRPGNRPLELRIQRCRSLILGWEWLLTARRSSSQHRRS